MKKLNKLQIDSEKLMKNEELTTLRGGYDGYNCCMCRTQSGIVGYIITTEPWCNTDCQTAYSAEGVWIC